MCQAYEAEARVMWWNARLAGLQKNLDCYGGFGVSKDETACEHWVICPHCGNLNYSYKIPNETNLSGERLEATEMVCDDYTDRCRKTFYVWKDGNKYRARKQK